MKYTNAIKMWGKYRLETAPVETSFLRWDVADRSVPVDTVTVDIDTEYDYGCCCSSASKRTFIRIEGYDTKSSEKVKLLVDVDDYSMESLLQCILQVTPGEAITLE